MLDTPVDLIQATIQIEQPSAAGDRIIGTGFLLSSVSADGAPGTVLVTANHVLDRMGGGEANIGYRSLSADGTWRYTPAPIRIRDEAEAPLWTRHPSQDVAVMRIQAPPEYAKAAIPAGYLAPQAAPDASELRPGDELLVLGFPRGVAANSAGFPILRAGRVASYPVSPDVSPTFLLDFPVFPGNSGGPVFATSSLHRTSAGAAKPRIAGLLVQQVRLNEERLDIGIVLHARYIRETVELLEGVSQPDIQAPPAKVADIQGARPASEAVKARSPWRRSLDSFTQSVAAIRKGAADALRLVSGRFADWLDPSPRPASGGAQPRSAMTA